ncbi:2721_t:CDS:2 [Cetraspora pellucida]|uniref:2721_t:CDS:1 n=1 Tax=Cetraspora pellucida TaxID=1433469 RepID=A0A9N9JI44_9GLOM|nr:2721_t:CDS:2 [Cetraspora pellucida]
MKTPKMMTAIDSSKQHVEEKKKYWLKKKKFHLNGFYKDDTSATMTATKSLLHSDFKMMTPTTQICQEKMKISNNTPSLYIFMAGTNRMTNGTANGTANRTGL